MDITMYQKAICGAFDAELTFSEEGTLVLGQGGDRMIVLQARPGDEAFSMTVDLGDLPDPDNAAVLRRLLDANYLYWETDGGAIGYDTVRNRVVYNYLLPVWNLSGEEFLEKLNVILGLAESWKEKFDALVGASDEKPAATAADATGEKAIPSGFIAV